MCIRFSVGGGVCDHKDLVGIKMKEGCPKYDLLIGESFVELMARKA